MTRLVYSKYAEEFGTLFFKPILKTLFPMNKGDMKKFEDNLVKEKRCNKYVSNVFNDFYTSEFETFGQYYRQREYEFTESKHSSGWPFTSNYRLSDDNKLREACRYNDHTIDFVKVYDAIVYIGSKQETDFWICAQLVSLRYLRCLLVIFLRYLVNCILYLCLTICHM